MRVLPVNDADDFKRLGDDDVTVEEIRMTDGKGAPAREAPSAAG